MALASARRSVPRISIPYGPRSVWKSFHESENRFRVAVAHRRAGKTVAFINELIRGAAKCQRPNPRFGYIAPLLGQAKAIAWDYVKQYAQPIPGVTFYENELRADLPNGGRVRLFGADNPDALRGLYFDGIVLDEFGDMDPRVWTEVVRPMLSDRNGWAAFGGTPRGKNKFYDFREDARKGKDGWKLWELKASETGVLGPSELAQARVDMDEASYLREYECSFDATVEGAYYAHEMTQAIEQRRICRLPIEPLVKVDTAWDIGVDDATAIWFFQDVGRERRLIDYIEVTDCGVAGIVKLLESKRYRYGRHILPHDADARETGPNKSYRQQLDEAKIAGECEIVPRTDDLIGDINTTRLHIARCWFDEDRCARGLECLKQYRREWDGKRQTWRQRPLHDQYSHGADAFRTLALSHAPVKRDKPIEIPDSGYV